MLDALKHLDWSRFIIIAIALLALALLIALLRRRRPMPYQSRPLFSAAEARFLEALRRAVGERADVYAKVRVADLVKVEDGVRGRDFFRAFNAIACKHVDYVLCDPASHAVLCVIELDDRSHERRDRQERDAFVDAVMQAAAVPIVHVPVQARYPANELRQRLQGLLPS